MTSIKLAFAGASLLALSACAVVQQNPYSACNGQPLCTAYGTYATVAYSTAYALNHDNISVQTAQHIQSRLDKIHDKLDAARAVIRNGGNAHDKLTTARAALAAIMASLPEAN